jgi:cytochrome c-type biogenesis protein CcmE
MSRDRRFFAGLVGVAAVVSWLVWTGISDTMVYYLTPSELVERAQAYPASLERGVKVSGDVVPGSYQRAADEFLHTFQVLDPDHRDVVLTVHFRHPLPDTFTDEAEVVMEGRYLGDGVFEATEVLTKCGSRYEALPEEMEAEAYGDGAGTYGAGAS